MTKLNTTPWESGGRTKLVPWEEEIILTVEETRILLELQEFVREPNNVGSRYQYVSVPTTIFDKIARLAVSMNIHVPVAAPKGSIYQSAIHRGLVASEYVGTLTYMWGAKGTSGVDPRPFYCIPVLNGNVCEWVPAEDVFLPLDALSGRFILELSLLP